MPSPVPDARAGTETRRHTLNVHCTTLSDAPTYLMKHPILTTSIRCALLALCAGPLGVSLYAQEAAAPVPAPEQALERTPPPVRVDPAPVTPRPIASFAPVVEKISASVVTISTSRNVSAASMRNNPLFSDPNFRRFFGIPDEDEQTDPAPQQRRGQRRGTPPTTPPGMPPGGGGGGGGGTNRQALGLGSGVIVSTDGHLLTNNHVVEGADDIIVTIGNNKREYKAKKIGTDPGTDLAVLKIDATDLPAITFGDSDKIRPGDIAIAVGNPFGLTQSVSMGVISAIGRGGMGIVDYENFIQTDASINPGNSGGALVDIEGRLVGVNTAIFSRSGGNQGIGFAVPANLAHMVMESIIKHGRVVRGYLGTGIQPLTEDLAQEFKLQDQSGALVSGVEPKSPAAKAGVQVGDVITAVNGRKVEGPRELRLMIGGIAPGTKVDLTLARNGQPQNVSAELAELPQDKRQLAQNEPAESTDPDVLDGVTVADIDAELSKELELPEGTRGVVITNVDPDSPSAAAGLRRGDVVHEINREPVTSAKQAVEMSEKLKKEKRVLLRVSSKGASRYVVVVPKQ